MFILDDKCSITQSIATKRPTLLCLDIDGTLAEFQLDPTQSFIPTATLKLLAQLQQHIPIIFITGRDLAQAQRLIAPLLAPIFAHYGLILHTADQTQSLASTHLIQQVASMYQQAKSLCQAYPELWIEDKTLSIAIHFRQVPQLAQIATEICQQLQHHYPDFKLQHGQMVCELMPSGCDKGQAILRVHQRYPNAHIMFIGDDHADEAAFAQVNHLHGTAIKVGDAPSLAAYRLKNLHQVPKFLSHLLSQLLTFEEYLDV